MIAFFARARAFILSLFGAHPPHVVKPPPPLDLPPVNKAPAAAPEPAPAAVQPPAAVVAQPDPAAAPAAVPVGQPVTLTLDTGHTVQVVVTAPAVAAATGAGATEAPDHAPIAITAGQTATQTTVDLRDDPPGTGAAVGAQPTLEAPIAKAPAEVFTSADAPAPLPPAADPAPAPAAPPPAVRPTLTGVVKVLGPAETFAIAPNDPPTILTWASMPWAPATGTGFRAGVDRLDIWAIIPKCTAVDPMAANFAFAVSSDSVGTDTVLRVNPGDGAPWPTTIANLLGVSPWRLTGGILFGTDSLPVDVRLDRASQGALTFADDFSAGLSLRDRAGVGTYDTRWHYIPADANGCSLNGSAEAEWYINHLYAPTAAVKPWSVQDGVLTIEATPAAPAIQPLINGYKWTSGQVNTFNSFNQLYGDWEIRARFDAGQGAWPAFWFMGIDGSWPPELDGLEIQGNLPMQVFQTLHGASIPGGQAQVVAHNVDTTAWHTYTIRWHPDFVTWFIDEVETGRLPTPADMHKPMYLILDMALGGWNGLPDASTPVPCRMQVDWVKVWAMA